MITNEIKQWVREWVAGWTRNRFFSKEEYQTTSRATASAGFPLLLDRDGKIDSSFYNLVQLEDANFTLVDDADNTKKMQFQLSGISAGQTRTLTVPDASGTLAMIDLAQAWTAIQTFLTNTRAGNGSGQAVFNIDGGTGQLRVLGFRTNSSSRWLVEADNSTESGSNAGSNFRIRSRTDADAALRTDLEITRSNGNWTLGGSLQSPTIVTPTIASFTNAQHDHLDADDGGTLTAAAISDFTEAAQDVIGALLVDSSEINYTYNDAGNAETVALIDGSIANARLANMAEATVKGRAAAAGTGAPVDLTANQLLAILNTATGNWTPIGSLVMGSGTTIFTASGGINFGHLGADALTWYDIGTWTPVFADAASGGNTGSVGTNNGYYVRIGNLVWVYCRSVDITTAGMTAGNTMFLRGLPFTSSNLTNNGSRGIAQVANVTFSGYVAVNLGTNVTAMNFVEHTSGAASANLTVSDFTSGTADVVLSVTYEVD